MSQAMAPGTAPKVVEKSNDTYELLQQPDTLP